MLTDNNNMESIRSFTLNSRSLFYKTWISDVLYVIFYFAHIQFKSGNNGINLSSFEILLVIEFIYRILLSLLFVSYVFMYYYYHYMNTSNKDPLKQLHNKLHMMNLALHALGLAAISPFSLMTNIPVALT